TRGHAVFRAERERVWRCVRLLAPFELGEQREMLDLRVEQTDGGGEVEPLGRAPIEVTFDSRQRRALRVRGDEQERRRIAEPQLQRDLDLLVLAPGVEHVRLCAQASVRGREPIATLDAREVLG